LFGDYLSFSGGGGALGGGGGTYPNDGLGCGGLGGTYPLVSRDGGVCLSLGMSYSLYLCCEVYVFERKYA